jgi:pimeloyl-ACP methyl ester carboxylesterase
VGTLLFDLLSESEADLDARTGKLRFDIDFLTWRLRDATEWALSYPETSRFALGYFGASTGAAAALAAAARRPGKVAAIVSRGGRPDLAGSALRGVAAPTLLVVGGHDPETLILNRRAYADLHCPKDLVVVPGATHLFSEPGALETVAGLATGWFRRHFHAD